MNASYAPGLRGSRPASGSTVKGRRNSTAILRQTGAGVKAAFGAPTPRGLDTGPGLPKLARRSYDGKRYERLLQH